MATVYSCYIIFYLDSGVQLMEETQTGQVILGPGAKRDGKPKLHKLSKSEDDRVLKAKKYAMEQGIKRALLKQTINHQQKVC